jgi:predicted HD phosphohydrolase
VAFTPKFLSNLTSTPEQRAEAFLKAGDKAKAAEAYAKAGLHPQAAKLFAETGNSRRAVETTLVGVLGKVPDGYSDATPLQAGELLASSGHHKEAIVLFELGADWKQAAESAAKLQLHAKAARFYEKARLWKLAANYYRRGNQPGDAARALEQESNRLKTGSRAPRNPASSRRSPRSIKRAELLGKARQNGEAATLLSNTMPTLKSGKLLEAAGRFEEAIRPTSRSAKGRCVAPAAQGDRDAPARAGENPPRLRQAAGGGGALRGLGGVQGVRPGLGGRGGLAAGRPRR